MKHINFAHETHETTRNFSFKFRVVSCVSWALFVYVSFVGLGFGGENTIASPRAVVGGRIRTWGSGTPKSLNYFLDLNSFSARVFESMFESLLSFDPLTGDYVSGLAKQWTISEDGRTFTFKIDPMARWSDGRSVTAEDVCWTFEKLVAPESLTGVHKMKLEPFETPIALDAMTVQFTATETHWRNLGAVGGMSIMPKHAYEQQDFNKINFEFPVVSGPYKLGVHREKLGAGPPYDVQCDVIVRHSKGISG